MNISFTSFNEITDAVNLKQRPESNANREVQSSTQTKKEHKNLVPDENELKLRQEIQESLTMDVKEVKDFLFMLIGAEVKVKPENNASGTYVDRIA